MLKTMPATTALALAVALSAGAYAADQGGTVGRSTPKAAVPTEGSTSPNAGTAPKAEDQTGVPSLKEPTSEAAEPNPSSSDGADNEAGVTATKSDSIIEKEGDGAVLADSVIGMKVMDASGKKIGKVKDIILDGQGRMTGLVVSVGGFIGIGAKKVGIRAEEANIDLEKKVVVADLEQAAIENAPEFKTKEDQATEQRNIETQRKLEQQRQLDQRRKEQVPKAM